MRSRRISALMALAAVLLAAGVAFAAADGLILSVFTGGGGRSESDGAVLRSAVGQPIAGRSDSGDVVLCAGWPGCQSVAVVVEPIAGLTAANDSPTALGEPTTLTAAISTGSDVTYAWAFGDGEVGSGAVVEHTYAAAGTYTATVTATNDVSSQDAETVVRILDTPYRVYLPAVLRRGAE